MELKTGVDELALRVRFATGEPAYGLFNRLALRHGAADAQAFVEQVPGLTLGLATEIYKGRRLDVLARLSGAPLEDLYASTVRVGRRGIWLGDVPLSIRTASLASVYGRICPECLDEDLDGREGPHACRPARRTLWDFIPLVTCPRHARALVSGCRTCGERVGRHWLDPTRCPSGHLAVRHPAVLPTSIGEDYLRARLERRPARGGDFLDALGVCDAGHAMVAIGITAMHGRVWPRMRELGPRDALEALTLGFEILSSGPHGVLGLLDRLAGDDRTRAGPFKLYGALSYWLSHAGGIIYVPLQKLMVEHYSRDGGRSRHGMLRDSKVLWQQLHILSDEFSITEARLLSLVEKLDLERLVGDGQPRVSPGAAARLRQMFADVERSDEGAAARLGISLTIFKRLRREGWVEPAVSGLRPVYFGSELDALVSQCRARAPRLRPPFVGTSIVEATNKVKRTFTGILRALNEGRLRVMGIDPAKRGLAQILVDLDDVRRAVPTPKAVDDGTDDDVIGAERASRQLGVSRTTVLSLLKAELLPTVPHPNGFAFRAQALDQVLACFRGDAPRLGALPPDVLPLPRISRGLGKSHAALLKAVRSGSLKVVGVLDDRTGLAALCFLMPEAVAVLGPGPRMQGQRIHSPTCNLSG